MSNSQQLMTVNEAVQYAKTQIDSHIDSDLLSQLERCGLLPSFLCPEKKYLQGDIDSLKPLLVALARGDATTYGEQGFFAEGLPAHVHLGNGTWLPLGDALAAQDEPYLCPALRHLAQIASQNCNSKREIAPRIRVPWLSGTSILTSQQAVAEVAGIQVHRNAIVSESGVADFARTAYYMGTKRDLGPFLVEALASVLPKNGVVLDLMCGSGAASGAFCRVWPTYVSDAQIFCQHLALVQGGGFEVSRAQRCLLQILETARQHELELRKPIELLLRREAEFCHSDLTTELIHQFKEYVASIPSISTGGNIGSWFPTYEVDARRHNKAKRPYCLFTAYFAGLYCGLRQAIEIDSLRFAVEHLAEEDRRWALGALVIAVSVQASTYAAHFAQPQPYLSRLVGYPSPSPLRRRHGDMLELTMPQLQKTLERWAGSIYREFSVRLESLARQSQTIEHPVHVIPGPWSLALDEFERQASASPIVAYLDAPYTRDEYSRYYHVLETLVRYDYPSATGIGRVPSKEHGERFASEFFTKTQRIMEHGLVQVICAVLEKGWTCAWSYSDAGQACISTVMEAVINKTACRVTSFAAPHRYTSQGGHPAKKVTEYLIVFHSQVTRFKRLVPYPN